MILFLHAAPVSLAATQAGLERFHARYGVRHALTPGIVDWSAVWPWIKAIAVLAMTGFHIWLGRQAKDFVGGTNKVSGRRFRMMNEVPTALMVIIVLSVIVKF